MQIDKPQFEKYKTTNVRFINHGLGSYTEEEHNLLVKKGYISCDGEKDMIKCDAFAVKVHKGSESVLVYSGDKHSCNLEAEKLRGEKRSDRIEIVSYPLGFIKHFGLDKEKDMTKEMETNEILNMISF